MKEWTKWAYNAGPKLDTLAKVLGLPTSKVDMDGSQVWPYYQNGKLQDICAYCMKDVVLTRQVYYKMNFETASEIDGIEAFTTVNEQPETFKPAVSSPSHPHEPIITASVIPNQTTLLGDTEEIPF